MLSLKVAYNNSFNADASRSISFIIAFSDLVECCLLAAGQFRRLASLLDGGCIKSMSFWRVALHVAVWSGVFLFWLIVTRQHHPTLTIAVSATAVLVTSFVLAVYANSLFLVPGFAQRRLWLRYVISLLATVAVLDLIAVLLIQFIYDRLWGADPLRYGFWFNMASDGFGIVVHVVAAMLVMWVARLLRRSASAQPSASQP
jgi:hypothetical protein